MAFDPSTLIYRGEREPEELSADLAAIETFDRQAEKSLRGLGCLFGVFFPGSLCMLTAAVAVAQRHGGDAWAPAIMVVFVIAFGAVALWLGKQQRRMERNDLDDRRYAFVSELLPLLTADLRVGAPVHVELDLAPIRSEHKKTQPDGSYGRYRTVHAVDHWLSLRGRFADGTSFRLEAHDAASFRFHPKRVSQNKVKLVTRLVLRLRPKAKRYGGLDALATTAAQAVQLPEGAQLKKSRFTEGDVRLTVAIKAKTVGGAPASGKSPPALKDVAAAMFLSAYQVLNLSRLGTRREGIPPPPA